MKNIFICIILFVTMPLAFCQSNTIPPGSYYSEDEGMGFYLIVDDSNNFQLSMAKGKVTNDSISNLDISKQKTSIFGIKYKEESSLGDSLKITFSKSFKSYHLSQIYIGTTNQTDDVPDYMQASLMQKQNNYTQNEISITVPKTKYLKLLEETYKKDFNILYEYEIPETVSKIEITYHPSQRRETKLNAEYDSQKNIVTINEVGRNQPLTFYRDFDSYLAEFKKPKTVTENIVWRAEETIMPSSNSSNNPYNFKLKQFSSYDEAIQTAKNDNKLLLAFYLPEGNNTKSNYSVLVNNYEQKLLDKMYDGYKAEHDNFHFYLIKEDDSKLINKLKLSKNQLIVLNHDESIIYRHKAIISDLSKVITEQISSYGRNDFLDMYLMKRIDDAVKSNTFNKIATQRIFRDLSGITAYDFFSGHDSVKEKTYREKQYIEKNIDYYKLKSNFDQVNSIYDQLIESHLNDKIIDLQFASIITRILAANYKGLLYKDFEPSANETELKSINYLIKFQKNLTNYKPISDEDYNNNYDFYNIKYTITSSLNRAANKADGRFLKKIKSSFKAIESANMDYLMFLKNHIPEDYLNEYMNFYNSNKLDGDESIIVRLDKMYEEANSKKAWDIYKNQIANEANEAAWVVVGQNIDKKFLREALKWSQTSLNIQSENPYYLDTYAQLLYKNGDKKSAIKQQTQAVKIISNDINRYSSSLLKTTKDVLERMKNGTY